MPMEIEEVVKMSGSGDIASSLNLDLGPEHTQLDVDKLTAPL